MPGGDELARLLDEHDSWLAVERGLAANSLSAYRRDLRRYAEYLRRHGLTDAALVDESTVAAYVDHLKADRDEDGNPRYAPSSIARALVAVRSFHRFCLEEGFVDADPSEEVGAPRVPQGIPKALTEDEVEALLGAVLGDGPRGAARPGDPRDALRHRRADQRARRPRPARPRLRRRARAGGRQGRQGASRPDRAVRPALAGGLPRARTPAARAPGHPQPGTGRSRAAQRPGRAADPAGVLEDRHRRRRPGRADRSPLTARAAPLVRDPHARPRGGHPRGPGAARPREPLDHPGVHQGVARAAAGRLRAGPSAGSRPGPRRR